MSDFFHDPSARILMTLGYSWEAIMFKQNGIFSQNQLESNPNWLLGHVTMGKLIQLPKPLSHTHKLGLLTTGWLWRLTSVIQHVFTLWTGHRTFHKGTHWWPVSILKAQGAYRLQTHSFPQEWILSTHDWSAFANGHKYPVIASKCTGDNTANCSLWWLMRCSETEWVRARGSCETLRSESLQRRSLRALVFTSAFKPHTHMSTARLKDTLILLTLVRQPNLPPTCYVLSCLPIAQPSHIRTSSNATFSAKPFQMTLVSTNDSPH